MANSTLNSKLASPSLIAAYTVVGAGKRAETLYVNSSGTATTVTFGMRQAKGRKAYYQVQYRWHYRYTGTQAVAHGADWTDFTDWQTPVAIAATTSQTTAIAAGSTASPDTWQRANYAPNKSYDYLRILDQSVTIGSNYDAVSYQLRARVYDYATNKHGSWVYSETIKVFKAAEVSDVTLHTGADGALDIDYNYKWDRGKALFVTIVKDATGRNLLRDTFKRTPVKQAGSVDGVDGTRSATNTIPLDLLKRKVQPNEVLRLNAYLATYDGARTYFPKPLTVNGEDAELGAPRITVAKDNARGVLQVKVYKTDADDDLDSVGCCLTWAYNGKDYSSMPSYKSVDTTINSTTSPVGVFIFTGIPVGITVSVTAAFRNSYRQTKKTAVKTTLGTSGVAYINPYEGAQTTTAQAFGNMSFDISTEVPVTVELPYGRTAPFAAHGKGEKNTISLKATIDENSGDHAPRATWQYWDAVRKKPGVYLLRLPDGQMYKIAVTSVTVSQARNGYREVSLSATEVS